MVLATAAALAFAAHAAPAHARLMSCAKSTDPSARVAVFEGSMRAWRHSQRLQLRFRLQSRTPQDPVWRTVHAPGFDRWQTSDAGVRQFVYDKRVERLEAPASYRVVVRFRWRNARGRIVGHAQHISRTCREPDPRPNLVVRKLLVYRLSKTKARYVAVVANTGRTAADAFAVRFDRVGLQFGEVFGAPLAPGHSARVHVDAAACRPGDALNAVADPDGLIDEHNETDNRLQVPCAYTATGSKAHLH
jgi:CARDB